MSTGEAMSAGETMSTVDAMSAVEQRFGGRVAVITGGAAGIGEGLVRYAASIGMRVVIADIDAAAAERLRAELAQAGAEVLAVAVDVTDPAQLDALAAESYRAFGRVDLLVNNAGIEQFGYLWDTPLRNWQRVVDINVSGVFHGIRSFLPRMIEAGTAASVWNLSSVGAVTSVPRQAPYLMSKHAVLGLTEALRLDVEHAGHPISVAAVLPAAVASQIFHAAGTVDDGDVDAAEGAREDMLALLPTAMDPVAAARAIFEQAAAGEFYLLPQPEYTTRILRERAAQLSERRPPRQRSR